MSKQLTFGSRARSRRVNAMIVMCATAAVTLAAAGCGNSESPVAPASAAKYKPDLTGADTRLRELYSQPNELLSGGEAAYDKRRAELKGIPMVVNKWASWCGPCRAEFPLFQELSRDLGGKVAFLGVVSNDNNDDARKFLNQRPLPYPSFMDQKLEISKQLPPVIGVPTTGFYSADGRLQFVKTGEYKSIEQLRADIVKHALGGDDKLLRK